VLLHPAQVKSSQGMDLRVPEDETSMLFHPAEGDAGNEGAEEVRADHVGHPAIEEEQAEHDREQHAVLEEEAHLPSREGGEVVRR
jgi:hypothetical protein